jgi:sec-independent protein translocase protein TatA
VLLVFGPKRLPEMGRSLGKGFREFKDSITGEGKEEKAAAELPSPEPVDAPEPESAPRERDRVT